MSHVIQASETEFDRLLSSIKNKKLARADYMPDDSAALNVMFEAWQRLKELGWREAMYCPKDGTEFEVIEAGSTGIHSCHYSGEWPKGCYLVHSDGDLWPSTPILFRLKQPT